MAARVRAFWPKATIQHVMLSPEMQYTELENRCALTRTVGSNPGPSAIIYERNRKQNSLTMKKCVEFRVVLDLKMSRP